MNLESAGERSSFTCAIALRNEANEVVTPDSMRYRIDCLTTGRTIRDWTDVTPSAEMSITVEPADNAIQSDRNAREQRQLTLVANNGQSNQFVDPDPIRWWVVNVLQGRSIVP